MMKKENVSEAVIRRLPRYYRQLTDLHFAGVVRISSGALGNAMHITASQVRQDFSCFGEFGQQGYGYHVDELRAAIGHILGVDDCRHLIVIGTQDLGRVLLQNFPVLHTGFTVDAAFDPVPEAVGSELNGTPVYALEKLDNYLSTHTVDVAALTMQQPSVQSMVNHLVELGVHGFWNFTDADLFSEDPNVKFENIHFADSLLALSYHITNR